MSIDPMDWAKRPGSQIAMRMVFAEARKGIDPRFVAAAERLVAAGHADETGKALRLYDGSDWVKA